jgi:hypothetical protein
MSIKPQREGSGILFRNDKKEVGSTQPDYTGSATIGGVEYRLSAWVKQGNAGKFMSLSLTPKNGAGAQTNTGDNNRERGPVR